MILRFLTLFSCLLGLASAFGETQFQWSQPGKLLLQEDFDSAELPKLFTVGVGDWKIVDGAMRGRQQAKDKHTAFRKIFLDHQNVIYEYDMKLEGEAFHQLLINWDLAHIAKCVVHYNSAEVYKLKEQGKREQMKELGHDNGLDPLRGDYSEPNVVLGETPLHLTEGQWYHVVVEMQGDHLSIQLAGHTAKGRHIGLTEKKDNFGFQAGGLEGYVYIDNIRVWEALPIQSKL